MLWFLCTPREKHSNARNFKMNRDTWHKITRTCSTLTWYTRLPHVQVNSLTAALGVLLNQRGRGWTLKPLFDLALYREYIHTNWRRMVACTLYLLSFSCLSVSIWCIWWHIIHMPHNQIDVGRMVSLSLSSSLLFLMSFNDGIHCNMCIMYHVSLAILNVSTEMSHPQSRR